MPLQSHLRIHVVRERYPEHYDTSGSVITEINAFTQLSSAHSDQHCSCVALAQLSDLIPEQSYLLFESLLVLAFYEDSLLTKYFNPL